MEASALHAPAGVTRLRNHAGPTFLRLRSDDQLVDLFRAGHEDAFRVIHDRYRSRLFAYMRQMLSGSRQDAEDALQDVFIRAYSGLRANDRHLALRAWLYRVAHNRCVDQLRKNMPILTEEIEATSQDVSSDPIAAMQQREDLRKLITDVQRLPEQQRSALLLREMSGMSYQELAESLDLSIPAIKSLLVRARVGLAAAAEARDTDCSQIHTEIVDSHERGARPNALTRRHLSDCAECRQYRESVRGVSRTLAALIPAGPLILAAKLLGMGTAYSAAAYSSGGAAAGGAAAGGAAAGGAAAGGAAAAGAGAVVAGGAAVGGGAAAAGGVGAAVAGGISAAHVAAIIAAAAAAGGAVAVTDQSSTHHASAPLHPASSVIRHAVESGIAHGYAPAAIAPVAPVAPVTPATAPATTAASTIANAVVSKLKHQVTTPASATTSPATTSTTAPGAVVGATATTPGATTSTGPTATGQTTATTAAGSSTTPVAAGTSTAPANSGTVAATSPASTAAGTSSAAATTPVHTYSTSSPSATTQGSGSGGAGAAGSSTAGSSTPSSTAGASGAPASSSAPTS